MDINYDILMYPLEMTSVAATLKRIQNAKYSILVKLYKSNSLLNHHVLFYFEMNPHDSSGLFLYTLNLFVCIFVSETVYLSRIYMVN